MFDQSRLSTDPNAIPLVAVACCQGSSHRHVGIAYLSRGEAMFIDQAWHREQRAIPLADVCKSFKGRVVFGAPDLDRDRAKALAGYCRAIAREVSAGRSNIAYAFRFDPDAFFDRHTGRLAMPSGKGLTCVTYALVIFKSAQLPLINFDGWLERDEDRQFHDKLVELLRPHVDPEHLKELQAEVRCVRCRPEEICGACACLGVSDPAVTFGEASSAGLRVIATVPQLLAPALPQSPTN